MINNLSLIIVLALLPFGCTLLGVESTKTQTITSRDHDSRSQYYILEGKIEELEMRISDLERKSLIRGGAGGTQPVSK